MKNWHKALFALILVVAMGAFFRAPAEAADDYEAQIAALESKQAQLDEEMSKASPDPRRISRLSREIGEINGKLLAAGAARRNYQGQAYPDYPDRRGYYGYGHIGYGHHGHHHGGGCW